MRAGAVAGHRRARASALLGHLHRMLRASGAAADVWADQVPLLPGAAGLAAAGFISSAAAASIRPTWRTPLTSSRNISSRPRPSLLHDAQHAVPEAADPGRPGRDDEYGLRYDLVGTGGPRPRSLGCSRGCRWPRARRAGSPSCYGRRARLSLDRLWFDYPRPEGFSFHRRRHALRPGRRRVTGFPAGMRSGHATSSADFLREGGPRDASPESPAPGGIRAAVAPVVIGPARGHQNGAGA